MFYIYLTFLKMRFILRGPKSEHAHLDIYLNRLLFYKY